MTSTLTTPDVSDLDKSAFEVPCDVTYAYVCPKHGIPHGEPVMQCDKPATFVGSFPCCGHSSFACTPHKNEETPWYCSSCHRAVPAETVRWVPL
jgi:hypothetical protein